MEEHKGLGERGLRETGEADGENDGTVTGPSKPGQTDENFRIPEISDQTFTVRSKSIIRAGSSVTT